MKRRRSLSRRDRGLAYANPMREGAIGTALGYLGIGAGVGGGLGAIGGGLAQPPDLLGGTIGGATIGVGLTAFGGFVVGLVSPKNRDAGFAAAGIGLGALILTNVAMNISGRVGA